jgi:hypothetical protein
VGNSNKLDQLQLEAARIVTGLPIEEIDLSYSIDVLLRE